MSPARPARLERRARALLRAYPAEYRRGRAEEIVGTLLESTPPGRACPPPRDAWSLIAGGLHARAVRNRRPGVAARLRLALLLGAAIFLSFSVDFYQALPEPTHRGGVPDWSQAMTLLTFTAAGLAPWLGSRAVTAALALAAAASLVIRELSVADETWFLRYQVPWLGWILLALGILVALSGNPKRLPGSWLWLLAVAPAAAAVTGYIPSPSIPHPDLSVLGGCGIILGVVVAGWLVTDARPAVGLSAALLLAVLQWDTDLLVTDLWITAGDVFKAILLPVTVSLVIALVVMWLLCRRRAPARRPLP